MLILHETTASWLLVVLQLFSAEGTRGGGVDLANVSRYFGCFLKGSKSKHAYVAVSFPPLYCACLSSL